MANPIFPLNEYIPDGEPHVFGDRVYLYGSHDKEGGTRFCECDYIVYSAPIGDLTDWVCHGNSYKKSQDPRSNNGKLVDYYAPDCVRGNDERYYLYYVAMGPNVRNFGPISVAVSNKPEGPFEYYGDVRYKDNSPVLKFMNNDPTVINDNGKIRLYYGWGLGRDFRNKFFRPVLNYVLSKIAIRSVKEVKATKPSILSCAVVELEDDMLTVKSEPKAVLDSKTSAKKNSDLHKHAFYEAPSIRKFNDIYYLVYSSGENSELAYATSKYPDRDFEYKGVLISNSDLGYKGNFQPKAAGGTIHGGIEFINGEYYVFYHRCTNNTNFSRQACGEKITMNSDGTFNMVEMTTQGLDNKPLKGAGKYSAVLCCNLFDKKTKTVQGNGKGNNRPNITCKNNERYITAISNGTVIGYKYFDFANPQEITATFRGGDGMITISTEIGGAAIAKFELDNSYDWRKYKTKLLPIVGIHALYFTYQGKKKIDFLNFELNRNRQLSKEKEEHI